MSRALGIEAGRGASRASAEHPLSQLDEYSLTTATGNRGGCAQDARSVLENQIFSRQRTISSMRATAASLQQQNAAALERLNAANTALAAAAADRPPRAPARTSPANTLCSNAPPATDGHGASLSRIYSPASCPLATDAPNAPLAQLPVDLPPLQQSPLGAPAEPEQHTHHALPARRPPPRHRAVLRRSTARSSTRPEPSTLPPPISSFPRCDGISYRDVLQASAAPGPFVDFSHASLRSLLGACKAKKAAAAHALPADVCWFLLSEYEVAPGLPLSYSSTLSSPECVAALSIHFLLLTFEFALCTAAGDHGACCSLCNISGGAGVLEWQVQ